MTLSELTSKCFSCPTKAEPAMFYIFTDEDSADNWIARHFLGENIRESGRDYLLLGVFQSDQKIECTLQDKWCKAEVQQFYIPAPDTVVVVLEELKR